LAEGGRGGKKATVSSDNSNYFVNGGSPGLAANSIGTSTTSGIAGLDTFGERLIRELIF
jgi:hypothetical protein